MAATQNGWKCFPRLDWIWGPIILIGGTEHLLLGWEELDGYVLGAAGSRSRKDLGPGRGIHFPPISEMLLLEDYVALESGLLGKLAYSLA